MRALSPILRSLAAAGLLTLIHGCGSSNETGGGTGFITVSVTPASATVRQGESTLVTGSVTRGGGFAGDVAVSVTGAPAGVTGVVTQAPVSGSSTLQVTLSVATSVAPGGYQLTVHATGSGVTAATASFALTVTASTPAGSFTLAATPATITVVQGAAGSTNITATRSGGFNGALTFAVTTASGATLPAGLTAAVTSTGAPDSYTLTANATAALAAGVYSVLVTASSPGVTTQNTAVAVTVTAAGSLVRLDFSPCFTFSKPIWLA